MARINHESFLTPIDEHILSLVHGSHLQFSTIYHTCGSNGNLFMHVSIQFLNLFSLFFLKSFSLHLQEVDKFTDLEQEMAMQGFKGIWKVIFSVFFYVVLYHSYFHLQCGLKAVNSCLFLKEYQLL
jgi:hypothetical protein